MMATKLLLLFYNVVFIIKFVNTESVGHYAIPEPHILAFEGGGLRVSLDDDSGINVFRFHANVNDEMKQLYPGTINIETSTKSNGKWVVEDRNVKLRVNDVIYYWMFVEKDRLGYVKQPVRLKIRHLVPYFYEDSSIDVSTTTHPPPLTTSQPVTPKPPRTEISPTTCTTCPPPTIDTNIVTSLQNQIDALNRKLDLLTSITALQAQVDTISKKFDGVNSSSALQSEIKSMSNTIELILMTLNRMPEAKKLTLGGVIPPNGDSNSDHTVRFVLWEKLDQRVDVVSAVRNKDGSINFELKTVQEKFSVLNAAKEKLKDSRITIS